MPYLSQLTRAAVIVVRTTGGIVTGGVTGYTINKARKAIEKLTVPTKPQNSFFIEANGTQDTAHQPPANHLNFSITSNTI